MIKLFDKVLFRIVLLLSIVFSIASCVPKKKLVYLQNSSVNEDSTVSFEYNRESYRLQVNDILDVQIRSMNPEVNLIFGTSSNLSQQQMAQAGVQSGGDLYYMTGYSIDDSGNVQLPVIGKVKVIGKTVEEAKITIQKEVEVYFSKYFLTVKLGGIRYSALGEFNRPGKYVILQNQATIFEAMANAGDLNMVAQRNEVTLIRQYPEGSKIHHINLLDQSIINSPLYFVQPNDVIYAPPMRQKSFGIGVTGAQTITTVISVISTSLALILAIQGINN